MGDPTTRSQRPVIVFACRHTGDGLIDQAVAAAREHMPSEDVLVVDSDSTDRSYMDRVDADIADIGNRHYATGAYLWALENRPADFYYLLHDSLMIRDDLSDLQEREATAVRWFAMPETTWGSDEDGSDLSMFGRSAYRGRWLDRYAGLFGPMVACTRSVLEQVADLIVKPATTKWEECAMERIWGMAFASLGHDLTIGSLQGEMQGYFDRYPSGRVEKMLMDRT